MGHERSPVMAGRDSELARLHAAVQRARQGEAVTVLVLGGAGVGKTRLVVELVTALRSSGDLVLTGHGVKMTTGAMPYAVASEILRDLVRQRARNPESLPPVDLAPFAPLLPDAHRDPYTTLPDVTGRSTDGHNANALSGASAHVWPPLA